jgi:hypothetical protein
MHARVHRKNVIEVDLKSCRQPLAKFSNQATHIADPMDSQLSNGKNSNDLREANAVQVNPMLTPGSLSTVESGVTRRSSKEPLDLNHFRTQKTS